MADWQFIATDLRTNEQLGALPLVDVQFSEVLNGAGGFTATMPHTRSTAAILAGCTIPGRCVVWPVRDGRVLGGAIVWARRRGKNKPVTLNGAGFWSYFRLQHLRVQKAYVDTDQLELAQDLIATAQSAVGADIGVTVGAEVSGVLRTGTYEAYELVTIAGAVEEAAGLENGFDFAIDATDGFGKVLTLSYPRRGRRADDTGIRFVDGKNIIDYDVLEDHLRAATIFSAIGGGDGGDMVISTAARTDLIDNGYPLISATGSHKNITDEPTLEALAIAGVNARAETPMFWKLTVEPSDPDGGLGTFTVGDDCILEIGDDLNFPRQADGTAGYSGYHRIISYGVTIPAEGKEVVEVELGAAA